MLIRSVVLCLAIAACNQPPGAASVSISPAAPIATDDLTLVFDAEAVDPNGKDVVAYDIVWSEDGTVADDLTGETTVPAARTRKGDTWTVTVTPRDDKEAGPPAEASVTVGNAAPVVTSVSVSPATVRTDDTLTATYQADDADEDIIDPTFTWRVNGTAVAEKGRTLSGASSFDKGDSVTVAVSVNDGDVDSAEVESSAVTVLNTAPGAPSVMIDPAEPTDQDNITCEVVIDADDADEDDLDYSFTWTIDGRSVEALGSNYYAGDTLLASQLSSDDVVVCSAVASDDEASGPAATDTVTVIGGFVPGFDGEPGPVLPGWLQCAGYLDAQSTEDIPDNWGALCAGGAYSRLRLVCGADLGSWRSIEVSKNVFRLGLTSYPEEGLISSPVDQRGTAWTMNNNYIYADGNELSSGVSWWVTGDGCNESVGSLTVNNGCSWEASNCFGQGLTGDRHLWVYAAP